MADTGPKKEELIQKDLKAISTAMESVRPWASEIKFGLNPPNESPALVEALNSLDHKSVPPAVGAGPATPPGPLETDELKKLVDFAGGGNNGKVPGIEAKHVEGFQAQLEDKKGGGLLVKAATTLQEIKDNARTQVNKLLTEPAATYDANPVTQKDWSKAFQEPLSKFENDLDARIKILTDEKFADVMAKYDYKAGDEVKYETAKQAQIDSLKTLKTTFRDEVEKLEKETLFKAIKTTEFKDTRPAAGGGVLRMGAGGAPATPLNDGALLNVFDHAELVRIKKMKLQDKVHFQRERIIRDAREEVKVNELLKTGSYETRNRDWLFKKNFQLTDHGIIINSSSGCTKDTINTMLDVYFAKTGQKSGELSFNIANGGKISLDFLMKIADTLDERRAATPQKQPTTLDFSAQAIKDMREMGYSSAQIQLLGQRLSNDPSWQPKQSAAPEHK